MPRPRLCRRIRFNPNITYFKPQGVCMRDLKSTELTAEDMDQIDAAKKMNTSQSTFQRILTSARKKVSKALIEGEAIKIIK